MLQVSVIYNTPVSSCCYLIYDNSVNNSCLIVDPGSEDNTSLNNIIKEKNLIPLYIFITHEHFDHCWGVNNLRSEFPSIKLVCSSDCSRLIGAEKTNMSVFYDFKKAFSILPADLLISHDCDYLMEWNGYNILFFYTPGHSSACVSIRIDKYLFSGDAYIPGIKTVTKLPNGNKEHALQSEKKILEMIELYHLILCPGH